MLTYKETVDLRDDLIASKITFINHPTLHVPIKEHIRYK